MERFSSLMCRVGTILLPPYSGTRVLIMPYKLEDPRGTLPDELAAYRDTVAALGAFVPFTRGTAYLTIDEAVIEAGETHRRPGLHVDGVGPDGLSAAVWGGPELAIWSAAPQPEPQVVPVTETPDRPPPRRPKKKPVEPPKNMGYLNGGMLLVASHVGCRGWDQEFEGRPGPDGDCAHLAAQCDPAREVVMRPGEVWWCGHLGVHEAIPMRERTARQVIRLSMPSSAPWYEGCTPNPLGILPDGPIEPRRERQMAYRP